MGQLNIDGHEVSDDYIDLPSVGKVEYELPIDQEWTPARGDRVLVLTEYVVEDVTYPLKHTSEGVASGKIKRVVRTRPIVTGRVTLKGVLTAQEIQAAWDAKHAGQKAS